MNDELERQANGTQTIAVGERAFVEAIEEQIHSRQQMMITEQGGSWVLREEQGAVLGPEKKAMSPYGGPFLEDLAEPLLALVRPRFRLMISKSVTGLQASRWPVIYRHEDFNR